MSAYTFANSYRGVPFLRATNSGGEMIDIVRDPDADGLEFLVITVDGEFIADGVPTLNAAIEALPKGYSVNGVHLEGYKALLDVMDNGV